MKLRRLLGPLGRQLLFARLLRQRRRRDARGRPRPPRARSDQGDAQRSARQRRRGCRISSATPIQTSVSTMLTDRELLDGQVQHAGAEVDDAGRQHVAAAHEEGVDRLLRLVLLLARRRQPEQLARGVHDRVVGRVLRRLDPADDREADAGRDDRVAAERDERQRQQHAAQAAVLDQPRGDERLEQERRDVDPELIVAAERADVGLLVERGVGQRQLLHVAASAAARPGIRRWC